MTTCPLPECVGTIDDTYCDECGTRYRPPGDRPVGVDIVRSESARPSPPSAQSPATQSPATRTAGTAARTEGGSHPPERYNQLAPPPRMPDPDPLVALIADPQVEEGKRFCAEPACRRPVGRGRSGRAGLAEGFCANCGTPFSFRPPLRPDTLVGGQYDVRGAIGHGGLGWVYLAWDRDVGRWVVLKGLKDPRDPDRRRAAVAELKALAKADHQNIVNVYNRVQHRHLQADGRTVLDVDYIVMQYVTGPSLSDVFEEYRARGEYLPVAQVCRYALQALAALGYLHDLGLLYCDFSPDNVIHTADGLRLIDLGAVRTVDDDEGYVWGKRGFRDPKISKHGASVGTDLYTVGRTMAVLSFPFPGFYDEPPSTLPDPDDAPLLARHDSFRRLLGRATAPDPARRFSSARDMAEQVDAVLREVLARDEEKPCPAPSHLFGPELRVIGADPDTFPARSPDGRAVALALPDPQVDPGDPHAGLLATISTEHPDETLLALTNLTDPSRQTRLRAVLARIQLGELDVAADELHALGRADPDDIRVPWYRGLAALVAGRPGSAKQEFTAVLDAVPGEAAPKLALAACAEQLGDHAAAARLYDTVWRTDRSYRSAAWGLARSRFALGDRAGMVEALESVPEHASDRLVARLCAILASVRDLPAGNAPVPGFFAAVERLDKEAGELRELDRRRRLEAVAEVLEATFRWVQEGKPSPSDSMGGAATPPPPRVLGHLLDKRGLRAGLEETYRSLAGLAASAAERVRFVDLANHRRNGSWW